MSSNNEYKVKIHVETIHKQNGEVERYVEDFEGQLIQLNNAFYLRYTEKLPDNEEAKVTFKIENSGIVQLTRKMGQHRMHLRFELEKTNQTLYHTPYGNVPMSVVTRAINSVLDDENTICGNLNIDYELYNGEAFLGDYKIRLQFSA
nr:DUF1934 domain-containing protein [uncultured Ligilactobacillus sp.]